MSHSITVRDTVPQGYLNSGSSHDHRIERKQKITSQFSVEMPRLDHSGQFRRVNKLEVRSEQRRPNSGDRRKSSLSYNLQSRKPQIYVSEQFHVNYTLEVMKTSKLNFGDLSFSNRTWYTVAISPQCYLPTSFKNRNKHAGLVCIIFSASFLGFLKSLNLICKSRALQRS